MNSSDCTVGILKPRSKHEVENLICFRKLQKFGFRMKGEVKKCVLQKQPLNRTVYKI